MTPLEGEKGQKTMPYLGIYEWLDRLCVKARSDNATQADVIHYLTELDGRKPTPERVREWYDLRHQPLPEWAVQ